MSINVPNTTDDQEIDLSVLAKKVSGFFDGIKALLFRGIQFFITNIKIIAALFVLGFGLGMYLDKTSKTYDHEIIVTPNFGSTDYLYQKIDLLSSKIIENDTVFFKSIGIKNSKDLKKIEIKPIVDVYKFVNNNQQNFELLKLMAEDGDLKKIVTETTTSKNYFFHTISISTTKRINVSSTILPLLDYLNTSEYYAKIQKEFINNSKIKLKMSDGIIVQIDGFLNEFSKNISANGSKSDKLVYYNENTQLNEVIKTKEALIIEQGKQRIDLVTTDKIIKDNSIVENIENKKFVNGKMKLVLPFLFLLMFVFVVSFMRFYRKQKMILENKDK